jgi:hypothetical protein
MFQNFAAFRVQDSDHTALPRQQMALLRPSHRSDVEGPFGQRDGFSKLARELVYLELTCVPIRDDRRRQRAAFRIDIGRDVINWELGDTCARSARTLRARTARCS